MARKEPQLMQSLLMTLLMRPSRRAGHFHFYFLTKQMNRNGSRAQTELVMDCSATQLVTQPSRRRKRSEGNASRPLTVDMANLRIVCLLGMFDWQVPSRSFDVGECLGVTSTSLVSRTSGPCCGQLSVQPRCSRPHASTRRAAP